jgi:serpin B
MKPQTRIIIFVSLAVLVSAHLAGCAATPGNEPAALAQSDTLRETSPNVEETALAELSAGNRAFAFDLYQAIRSEKGNLFFSPYSLSVALAMTYVGARGETEQQMAQVLHFTLPQDQLHPAFNALDLSLTGQSGEGFRLATANALWAQKDYTFLPGFLDTIALNYGGRVRLVDFIGPAAREQARQTINDWVSGQTEDKIKDLLAEGILTNLTRLVLTNAIYFKADWEEPFDASLTMEQPFTRLDNTQVTVPMMEGRGMYVYAESDEYQAIEIPYKGGRAAMVILLPKPGQFEIVESSLDGERVSAIVQSLQPRDKMLTDVRLYLPKFQYEASLSLKDTLTSMGMPDAFDAERADFSGMDGTRNLLIAHIIHKAFVAVDEKGTEAAAASGVVMRIVGEVASEPIIVRCDRPFIFLIHDQQTGAILFAGRVLDPTAK